MARSAPGSYPLTMARTVLFGRYRLLAPAGSGGSAQVWRAFDTKTKEEVAVKRLHPIVFADAAGRRRLEREFRALRALDEKHVVRVRDLHIKRNDGALVLDYVPGESLADRLASGAPVPAGEAVSIVSDIAAALAAAHAAGIVHRDVTPGNILLDPSDGARLTDFGIAQGGDDGATATVTADGHLVGTLRFLAPEQLRGEPATPSSDLHSLAAVAYEMLAGRPAYVATTPLALAEAQARGPARIEGVSRLLDEAVRRGLAANPADRQPTVTAFADELVAALEDAETAMWELPSAPVASAAAVAPVAPVSSGSSVSSVASVAPEEPVAADVSAAGPEAGAAAAWAPAPASPANRPQRRPVPMPLVALFALLFSAFALAAIAPGIGSPAVDVDRRSSPPAAAPAATPVVTPEPTPPPDEDDEGDKGKGNGKGNDKGKGKGDD
jgi:serine/threonine protein kinase